MEHTFTLPIIYKGQELELEAKWVRLGYISCFNIVLEGQELVFELDDENQYRVRNPGSFDISHLDKALIESVIEVLEKLRS